MPILLRTLLAALLLLAPHAARADEQTLFERWYVVRIVGQPSGWSRSVVTRDGDRLFTDSHTSMSVKRGQVTMTIEMSSRFEETADHKPVAATSTQKLGAMEITQSMRFTDAGIEMTVGAGQQEQTRKMPAPKGEWLTPVAGQALMARQLAAGEKTITYRSIEPAMGPGLIELKTTVIGREDVETMGKVVPALVVDSTLTPSGGGGGGGVITTRAYVDELGQPLKVTMALLPGMEMELVQADRELAQAQIDPPELMARTLIKPDRPVVGARSLRQGVFLLTVAKPQALDGAAAVDDGPSPQLPRAGYQRVVHGDAETVIVTVDLDEPVNPESDLPTDAHRQASAMIGSEDEKVRELVNQALSPVPDDGAASMRAEAMRKFVGRFIQKKDLSVGLATAGEVARTGQGDCTEHAVLLAAMLRADGIPSRTVSGLVYVDQMLGVEGVFGYHMWTQAWLADAANEDGGPGGRWVDLDATLGDAAFDASHIALATSAMSDAGMVNDILTLMPLIGRLQIRVIEPPPPEVSHEKPASK